MQSAKCRVENESRRLRQFCILNSAGERERVQTAQHRAIDGFSISHFFVRHYFKAISNTSKKSL